MYLLIRCKCGRFLYAKKNQKTRSCPCGKKVNVNKMQIYARVTTEQEAGEAVRILQEKEWGKPGFRKYDING
ncbi:MAG: DUF1922 domain-containing protein [Methanocellales archaeon]|nr:DUF1922 domain-containing protein [Methanocellales archaeon]